MGQRRGRAGRLRIIGGTFGGRFISAPPGRMARPTLAQTREAVFNVLGDRIEGATCADLFAGSGAYGLEALSRGASRVEAFERNRVAYDTIRANVQALVGPGVAERFGLRGGALPKSLERAQWAPYDLVFMDAPWGQRLEMALCEVLVEPAGRWLADDAWIVVEQSQNDPQGDWDSLGLRVLRERAYGEARVTMLCRNSACSSAQNG